MDGKQNIFVSLAVFASKQHWRMGDGFAEVENHSFVKQSSPFPACTRKGKTVRIQLLWQPNRDSYD